MLNLIPPLCGEATAEVYAGELVLEAEGLEHEDSILAPSNLIELFGFDPGFSTFS